MRSPIISVWILVIPGVFLQMVGSEPKNLVLFGLGTAVQGVGLWIHCRAKGRNRWWALLALAPWFGWVGAVHLRSQAQLEAIARERASRAMTRENSRLSRMAVGAFAAGAAYQLWPLFVGEPGIPTCRGMTPEVGQNFGSFLAIALPLSAAALLFGLVANFRINRSRGSLRGHWLAQFAVLLSMMNLLQTIALPRFFLWREIGAEKLALRTLHRAEEGYRSRYPETGYSPDLRSLGPPPRTVRPSVERAGVVDGSLSEGIYCAGKDRLIYEPRAGDDGTIVAYTVHLKSRWTTRLMDETGSIRFVANPPE
jgi:hypothetical protein